MATIHKEVVTNCVTGLIRTACDYRRKKEGRQQLYGLADTNFNENFTAVLEEISNGSFDATIDGFFKKRESLGESFVFSGDPDSQEGKLYLYAMRYF
jgi:DNA phosphorothioation-dependent restriction protein DptG